MTHKEAVLELFRKKAREIYIANAPWLPEGVNISLDSEKYWHFKNQIQDKVLAIDAPDIEVKTRLEIIASLEDELDSFINEAIRRKP